MPIGSYPTTHLESGDHCNCYNCCCKHLQIIQPLLHTSSNFTMTLEQLVEKLVAKKLKELEDERSNEL